MTRARENQLHAKAEVILMGIAQPVDCNEEAELLVDYMLDVLNHNEVEGKDVIKDAIKYCKNGKIRHITTNTIEDMAMITLTLETDEDEGKYDVTSPNGVLSYVYNVTCPLFSELGYTFFEIKNGKLHRYA